MTRRSRVGHAFEAGTHLVVLIVIAVTLVGARSALTSAAAGAQAGAAAPATELPALAASAIEAAVGPNGHGVRFQIVQRSSFDSKPGGPKVDIPKPGDRHGSLGLVDHYEIASSIEDGWVTPAGFWSEIRDGPKAGGTPDWEAPVEFSTIVRDGVTWRDDGQGWFRTDSPPGIGLDPLTAALLPRLLRQSSGVVEIDPRVVGNATARTVTATGHVADVPGVLAADGETFTELRGPLEYSFDAAGRIIQAHIVARNTTVDPYDLLVDTVITFTYPGSADDIPLPKPTLDASASLVVG